MARLEVEVERLLRVRDSAQALIDYEDAGPDSDSGDWMYWEEKFMALRAALKVCGCTEAEHEVERAA